MAHLVCHSCYDRSLKVNADINITDNTEAEEITEEDADELPVIVEASCLTTPLSFLKYKILY